MNPPMSGHKRRHARRDSTPYLRIRGSAEVESRWVSPVGLAGQFANQFNTQCGPLVRAGSDAVGLVGPDCEFNTVANFQLRHEARKVCLDRAETDVEVGADLGVGAAPCHG